MDDDRLAVTASAGRGDSVDVVLDMDERLLPPLKVERLLPPLLTEKRLPGVPPVSI